MGVMSTYSIETPAVEANEQALRPPPFYKVLLLNDDFTPMDFVVELLERFFHMERERAVAVMLKVHHEGAAVCGIYPKDIAATKVSQVIEHARSHGHPLACTMEEA